MNESLTKLPRIMRLEKENRSIRMTYSGGKKCNSFRNISELLNEMQGKAYGMKENHHCIQHEKAQLIQQAEKVLRKAHRKQKKKKKISSHEDRNSAQNCYEMVEYNHLKNIAIKEIITKWKPPHRYKTAMIWHQNSLVLFGGLGCEKKLLWAKLSLSQLKWSQPDWNLLEKYSPGQTKYQPRIPIYGHTMVSYKSTAYIFGGISTTDASNDLINFNLTNMKLTPGSKAPYRRKEHAAIMLGKYMVIYGGIERFDVKNTLFYYDTELDRWNFISSSCVLPALANHSMTIPYPTFHKKQKKINNISDVQDWIYIFGGKNEKLEPENRLYRLKIKDDLDIEIQELCAPNGPSPRHSLSFRAIDSSNLLVYGGRQNQECEGQNQNKGVFNDIYLYNLEKASWRKPDIPYELEHKYGMATTGCNGRVFLFGGCLEDQYTNGHIFMFKLADFMTSGTSRFIEEDIPKGLSNKISVDGQK